jgi:hypothetical protein
LYDPRSRGAEAYLRLAKEIMVKEKDRMPMLPGKIANLERRPEFLRSGAAAGAEGNESSVTPAPQFQEVAVGAGMTLGRIVKSLRGKRKE